jgi:hypothetical protein
MNSIIVCFPLILANEDLILNCQGVFEEQVLSGRSLMNWCQETFRWLLKQVKSIKSESYKTNTNILKTAKVCFESKHTNKRD